MKTNIPYASKISDDKLRKVIEVSEFLGINPAWLMFVINFESAGTFSPSKTNHIGSVGLIQFTRDKAGVNYKTINGKRYSLAEIGQMSFNEQMDLVQEYYRPYRGKIKSFLDCYLVTFFPVAIGKSDDYVLQTSGLSASLIATQNPIFDLDKNKSITKGEIKEFFRRYTKELYPLISSTNKPQIVTQTVEQIVEYLIIPVLLFFLSFYSITL